MLRKLFHVAVIYSEKSIKKGVKTKFKWETFYMDGEGGARYQRKLSHAPPLPLFPPTLPKRGIVR